MLFALWVAFLVVHSIYILVFSFAIALKKGGKANDLKSKISVIVASHNDLDGLQKLIPQLLHQEDESYEVIIALDRSNDGSKEFLIELDSNRLQVVEISETPNGWDHKKYALTQAIEKAEGDWLIYTDADCVPASNHWLTSFRKQMTGNIQIILGVSPYFKMRGLVNAYICYEAFQTALFYIGSAILSQPYMAVGRNLAVKRNLFLQSEGYESFKEIKGGDDDLFIQRFATKSNTTINIDKDAWVYSEPKTSWSSYFLQKLRHFSIGSKYRISHLIFLWLFHLSHLLFILLTVLVSDQKNFWLVILFYLTIKLVSFRFVGERLGMRINYLFVPVVDIQYALLTPVIAFWSKLVKDIPWKN